MLSSFVLGTGVILGTAEESKELRGQVIDAQFLLGETVEAADKSKDKEKEDKKVDEESEVDEKEEESESAEDSVSTDQKSDAKSEDESQSSDKQEQSDAKDEEPDEKESDTESAEDKLTAIVPTFNYNTSGSYPTGQCTWGVKVMAPWVGDWWGNAGQWAASASQLGFEVGTTPKPGAIACWNDGGYGHVALVVEVESETSIQVYESNFNGNMSIGNYRGFFDPTTAQGTVTYIYPNE